MPSGCGPSARTLAVNLLDQADRSGFIQTVFCQEARIRELYGKGRRHNVSAARFLEGYKAAAKAANTDAGEENPVLKELGRLVKRLQQKGVPVSSIGTGAFPVHHIIRDIARSDLPKCYVLDLVNAHPRITYARHNFAPIGQYIDNRDGVLATVHSNRDKAKVLVIAVFYGGTVDSLMDKCDSPMSHEAEQYLRSLESCLCEVRRLDARRSPHLAHLPPDVLQYVMNTEAERVLIDKLDQALTTELKAVIMAPEHDGFFYTCEAGVAAMQEVVDRVAGPQFPVTIKPTLTLKVALQNMKKAVQSDEHQSPYMRLWDLRNKNWREHVDIVRKAGRESLSHHGLFAEVVDNAEVISPNMPHRISELFKLLPTAGNYAWYSVRLQQWVEGGPNGVCALKNAISHILQRELSGQCWSSKPCDKRWDVTGSGFTASVEQVLRQKLVVDANFHLDPASSLRYLNFQGSVYDRETDGFIDMTPDLLISRCTHYKFAEPAWPAGAARQLSEALEIIGADWPNLAITPPVPLEARKNLDALKDQLPELKFWHDLTKDWEVVLYELCHLARGAFGKVMAESLFVRGVGRNGKDTVCNKMHACLGSYAVSITSESLCHVKNPDAPSPTTAKLRARRIVCVREVDPSHDMKAYLYKQLCDPCAELQGRDLFEKLVVFSPQYLLFFASNAPMKIAVDTAVKERTAVVVHKSVFKDTPMEANDVKWVDIQAHLGKQKLGDFAILRAVYRKLLHGRQMRNVMPVPQSCQDIKSADLVDERASHIPALMQKLKPVSKPKDASLDEEVRTLLSTVAQGAISANMLGTVLEGAGFALERRRRGATNVNLYMKRFDGLAGPQCGPQNS